VSSAILSLRPENSASAPVTLLFMNDGIAQKFDAAAIGFYQSKGLIEKFDNLEAVAKSFDTLDIDMLKQTLEAYNESAKTGVDSFGKTIFPTTFDPATPICKSVP
jgi:hypothetical protein